MTAASTQAGAIVRLSVLLATLGLALAGAGCGFGESGVKPPLDRIFLPGGMAVDPEGRWLYVVNSNTDLRYNAGTLVAVDLALVAEDRARAWGDCPSPGYTAEDQGSARYCCRDFFDPATLNCKDRGYLNPASTIQLGSFGTAMVLQERPSLGADRRRLYIAVRAEPSVTFLDVTVTPEGVSFRCRDDDQGPNPLCDDTHKVRSARDIEFDPQLAEEPHTLVLDPQLELMYVAHANQTLSLLDTCEDKPALVSFRRPIFDLANEWLTSVTLQKPGDALAPVFVTGRNLSGTAAQIKTLYLDGAAPCQRGVPRGGPDLVPGAGFYSSAFYPYGADIRGLLLDPDGRRAYVLHRNGTRFNPAALVAIDRSPDAQGEPANRAIDVVETCAGAMEMRWHDAGRGPRIFVVCFEAGQVYVIDPQLMVVSAVINTGRGPSVLAFSPLDPTIAYVSGFSDNDVSVVDLRPGSATEYKVVQRIGFPYLRGR
jgi:DNA-binding beta-propeller fold protein YncE